MRLLPFLLAAVLSAACTDTGDDTGTADDRFRVALLSPGPVSDAGWNALAYEGLLRIRDDLDAAIAQEQTTTPAQFEEGFRDFARRGYDLVFGHGFEFQEAAATVAAEFPDTVFITTSGNTVRPNVAPIRFLLEQATFLEGVLAASMSEAGMVGAVGGIELPSVESTILAFAAGAHSVDPELRVVKTYVGSWEDIGGAKEAARALVRQGADFLFHNADAAGLGVLQVAAETDGVWAFGANKNQNDVAPQAVIASAVMDIPGAFVQVAREVRSGEFVAEIKRKGMREGVIRLELNPALKDRIPAAVRQRIEKVREQILAGEIEVPTVES